MYYSVRSYANMTTAISNKQAKRNRRLDALRSRLARRAALAGTSAPAAPANAAESNLARPASILARLAGAISRLAPRSGDAFEHPIVINSAFVKRVSKHPRSICDKDTPFYNLGKKTKLP